MHRVKLPIKLMLETVELEASGMQTRMQFYSNYHDQHTTELISARNT